MQQETDKKLITIGQDIDKASDESDSPSLMNLIESCQKLLKKSEEAYKPIVYYYQANAYSALDRIEREKKGMITFLIGSAHI